MGIAKGREKNGILIKGSKCPFVSMFWTQNARFEESWSGSLVWFSIKRYFLEKVAFWPRLRTHKPLWSSGGPF